MRATDTFRTVTGKIQRESEKAILIRIKSIGGRTFHTEKSEWFPFSQVNKTYREPASEENDYLVVSEWILNTKGLLDKKYYVQPSSTPSASSSQNTEIDYEQNQDIPEDDVPF